MTLKIVISHLCENTLLRYSSGLMKKIQKISACITVENFPSKNGKIKKTSESWRLFQGKHKKIVGIASDRTRPFGITQEYSTQVFDGIECSVTKKLSQEFNRTESSILGSLSKLGDFLFNPQVRTLSGTVPGTSQNNDMENSQNDPHPEVEFSACRSSKSINSDPKETFTLSSG